MSIPLRGLTTGVEIFMKKAAGENSLCLLYTSTFGRSLHIRHPQEKLSIAENFLYMLKKDYTELDARTLDLLLILQAEHGGGNNSTFTVRVTSSTGTDTYSAIAAGIGSLKGPLHGGANLQVADMFQHLKENIKDWTSVDAVSYTHLLEHGPVRCFVKIKLYSQYTVSLQFR